MKLTIPDVPPSLNKQRNLHWAAKARLRDAWRLLIRSQMGFVCPPASGKMKCRVTLCHARPYDECDNMQGACKPLFDALKHWGLIFDDAPKFLEAEIRQESCPHKQRHTIIELETASSEGAK